MATARRFYLYVVSAFALGLLLQGMQTLLRLVFDHLGMGPTDASAVYQVAASGLNPEREALSGGIALTVVGLVLWLIHWGFTERLVRGDGAEADAERRSTARSVFFALVLIVLLWNCASSAIDFIREGLARPLGATDPFGFSAAYGFSLSNSLSIFITYGVAWAYYAWFRFRDTRQSTLQGPAAWISRMYLYGAAFIGVATVIAAASSIVGTAGDMVAGHNSVYSYDPSGSGSGFYGVGIAPTAQWWVRPILAAGAQLAVWVPVWLGHWIYSNRICDRADDTGTAERLSRVRLTFLALVVVSAVGYVIFGFGQGLGTLLGTVIGAQSLAPNGTVWRDIVVPPLAAVVPIAFWFWHRRRAIAEGSALPQDPGLASPVRVIDYLTALVGAAAFTGGLAFFLGEVLQKAFAGASAVPFAVIDWRWQAIQAAAIAIAALPVWLWPWLAGIRRASADPVAEARRTSRRAYLYVVVGGTLVSGAGLAAFVAYRLLRAMVGLDSSDLGSEIGYSIGALLAVAPVLAYHLMVLREDSTAIARDAFSPAVAPSLAPAAVPETQVAEVNDQVLAAAPLAAPPARELVIVGPAGADFESLRASLADRLPAGYSMQLRPAAPTTE
jgi:hypothetical protein